ncbi:Protein CBG12212 [Caenorhabditis briggsae]|uniref:Protein CBG12212 n=1 Tax=Caenorhabditis briggsae TaxID=6238 RepID=A8XEZ4_CAEBR|nr:Protein CBG12212 [Caenorhabditis briggsae]CAP31216.1 Protein CBG12212 [Caenorhabditis briggsae]
MFVSYRILILLSLVVTIFSLECYTGFTYLKAQSVGTSKETCSSPNDYCYNMTADLTSLNNVKKATYLVWKSLKTFWKRGFLIFLVQKSSKKKSEPWERNSGGCGGRQLP